MRLVHWVVVVLALVAGCGGGGAMVDSGAPVDATTADAGGSILGTWATNTISTSDQQLGVTASESVYVFSPGGSWTASDRLTFGPTAMVSPGCTSVTEYRGTYTTSGASTISLILETGTSGRTGCANASDNQPTTPIESALLGFARGAYLSYETYTLAGNSLTIRATPSDGGLTGETLALTRR